MSQNVMIMSQDECDYVTQLCHTMIVVRR